MLLSVSKKKNLNMNFVPLHQKRDLHQERPQLWLTPFVVTLLRLFQYPLLCQGMSLEQGELEVGLRNAAHQLSIPSLVSRAVLLSGEMLLCSLGIKLMNKHLQLWKDAKKEAREVAVEINVRRNLNKRKTNQRTSLLFITMNM